MIKEKSEYLKTDLCGKHVLKDLFYISGELSIGLRRKLPQYAYHLNPGTLMHVLVLSSIKDTFLQVITLFCRVVQVDMPLKR